jgi:SAM-dependent methyltransferase
MPKAVENFSRDIGPADTDGRLEAPAYHRNKAPLTAVLMRLFAGRRGDVLEIGSGTGQHAVTFGAALPELTYWPTDPVAEHVASIDAWRKAAGVENVRPGTRLDCLDPDWTPGGRALAARSLAAVIAINVIHIAPWAVAEAILAGAAKYLAPDGLLIFYGPFKKDGEHTAESNARFDAALRERNPAYGVRDLGELREAASRAGMTFVEEIQMPANNLTVVFGRQ